MIEPTPKIVVIPNTRDTIIQKDYLREYSLRHYPDVKLIRLDRAKTYVDDLYHEAMNREWLDPVTLKCFVQHSPQKKTLLKYGLDEKRDVIFEIPTLTLSDLGILENNDSFLIGDLIQWGMDTYEIKDQARDTEAYWINTNIPFYIAAGANYYRMGR